MGIYREQWLSVARVEMEQLAEKARKAVLILSLN